MRYSVWISLVLSSLLTLGTAQSPPSPPVIRVHAHGAGVDQQGATDKALRRVLTAQTDALMSVNVAQRDQVLDFLEQQKEQLIYQMETVSVKRAENFVRVEVDVQLLAPRLVEMLISIAGIQSVLLKPRLLIALDDTSEEKVSASAQPVRILEHGLVSQGFAVLTSAEPNRQQPLLLEAAREAGAELLITGDVYSEALPGTGNWSSCRIGGEIRAVQVDNGQLVGSWVAPNKTGSVGPTPSSARERAWKRHLPVAVKQLSVQVLSRWVPQALARQTVVYPHSQEEGGPRFGSTVPEHDTSTEEDSVYLRGTIRSASTPLRTLQIRINGTEDVMIKGEHWIVQDGVCTFDRSISLVPGTNTIQLHATDQLERTIEHQWKIHRMTPMEQQESEHPVIDIHHPVDGSITDEAFIRLRASTRERIHIQAVSLFVGDVNVRQWDSSSLPDIIDELVPLEIGKSIIRIVVTDSKSDTTESHLEVHRQQRSSTISPIHVSIHEPANNSTTTAEQIVIAGEALANAKEAEIQFLVNGQPLLFARDLMLEPESTRDLLLVPAPDTTGRTVSHFRQSVPLEMGTNHIEVKVTTETSSTDAEVYITRQDETPIRISLEAPRSSEPTTKRRIDVAASIQSSVGKPSVRIMVNEQAYPATTLAAVGPESGEYHFRRKVFLTEGVNLLQVEARVGETIGTSKLDVMLQMPNDMQVEAAQGTTYAVVIGISSYHDEKIQDLNYARADGEAFACWLQESGNVLPQNLSLLVDEQATQQAIRKSIGEWLPAKLKPQDSVILFYSGHGGTQYDWSGEEADDKLEFLISHETEHDSLYATALSNMDMSHMLARLQCAKLVFFIDCCYSGGTVGNIDKGFVGQEISRNTLDRLAGRGRIVISASDVDEVSYEDPEKAHGIFTYYLLEGLACRSADSNHDGQVTLIESYLYVWQHVTAAVRKLDREQTPTLYGNLVGDIVLTRYKVSD